MKKACPKCKTKHEKKGTFCSRACANSRTWTEEDKQKKRESVNKYYATDNSIAQREAVTYQNTLRHADDIEDVDLLPYLSSNEGDGDYDVDQAGNIWRDCE